jgi:glycosyltransferase involved in cell wall biosynthesis
MTLKETQPGITVLICTYNGASRLSPTLNALLNQKNTQDIPWEIILVDNASTDDTSKVASDILSRGKTPFRIIHEPKPGRDHALKTGFKECRYEYVCNVDDDTWVCEDYIYRVFQNMTKHPEVGVCGGCGSGAFEVPPPPWLEKYQNALAIGPQGDQEGYVSRSRSYLYGACAVYRKSLWNLLHDNGFRFFLSGRKGNKLNSGEDSELSQAWMLAGYKLWYDPGITFQHYMPAGRLTWDYFRKLYKAFGRSDLVMRQYQCALGLFGMLRKFIINHYLLLLIQALLEALFAWPGYIVARAINREGDKQILESERKFAFFGELLSRRKRYLAVKSALKTARWMSSEYKYQ